MSANNPLESHNIGSDGDVLEEIDMAPGKRKGNTNPRHTKRTKNSPTQHVNPPSLSPEEQERQDLKDLLEIAYYATPIEFDETGRPLPNEEKLLQVEGLIRTTTLPDSLRENLKDIHGFIRSSVSKLMPWAGVGTDERRVRGLGLLGPDAYKRLMQSDVQLRAQEKTGWEAERDEDANHEAICVLEGEKLQQARSSADQLLECIQPNASQKEYLHTDQLIAYQPNLQQGASHLVAHLDYPLHDGFGKVIVTVAMRGNATIILIGPVHPLSGIQPAWKFTLSEGQAYVLSGKARNQCLHAVIAEHHGPERESLNLRFGLHSSQEAYDEVVRFWPNEE